MGYPYFDNYYCTINQNDNTAKSKCMIKYDIFYTNVSAPLSEILCFVFGDFFNDKHSGYQKNQTNGKHNQSVGYKACN